MPDDPRTSAVMNIISERIDSCFSLITSPETECFGIERAEATTRDLSEIGAAAARNSMSFISAPDEQTHENAAAARTNALIAAIPQLAANPKQGEERNAVLPGLRETRIEHTRVFFTTDDERRMIRILLLLPA